MDEQTSSNYSYLDSGFNEFFQRGLNTGATETGGGSNVELDFDNTQVGGSLGDTYRVGRIFLDGTNGKIDVQDTNGQVTVRIES